MVVMDQFSRKIIGFVVHPGILDGAATCCLFNQIISGQSLPKYLSTDHDPLFKFHRWQANLRILEVEVIKTVPYTPTSHPFIERVIKTIREELLDRTIFFTANDLQRKLNLFQNYYNEHRSHMGISGKIPTQKYHSLKPNIINIQKYHWKSHCQGLFQLPIAA